MYLHKKSYIIRTIKKGGEIVMTYSEFAKIAPRETVDFVDKTLPYLKYYLENNYSIEICS